MRTKEEIIGLILKDRTELRKETISFAASLYDEKVMERLLRGEIINYGFFQLSLSISGKFKLGDHQRNKKSRRKILRRLFYEFMYIFTY